MIFSQFSANKQLLAQVRRTKLAKLEMLHDKQAVKDKAKNMLSSPLALASSFAGGMAIGWAVKKSSLNANRDAGDEQHPTSIGADKQQQQSAPQKKPSFLSKFSDELVMTLVSLAAAKISADVKDNLSSPKPKEKSSPATGMQ